MKKIVSIIFISLLFSICCATLAQAQSTNGSGQLTITYPDTDIKIILSDAYITGKRTWTSMSLWNPGPFESTLIIARPGCTITFSHTTVVSGFRFNGDSGTEYNMGIAQIYKPETYSIEQVFEDWGNDSFHMIELSPQETGNFDSYCISLTDAVLSSQGLSVNEEVVDVEKYNINGNNYFKLRDIAYLLNGTSSQFSVFWDGFCVHIQTGEGYTPNGLELSIGEDNSLSARRTEQHVYIDGELRTDLSAYYIKGNNFFKLRDLGDALGFEVDYDSETKTAIIRTN